jgi:hypothetical protein
MLLGKGFAQFLHFSLQLLRVFLLALIALLYLVVEVASVISLLDQQLNFALKLSKLRLRIRLGLRQYA